MDIVLNENIADIFIVFRKLWNSLSCNIDMFQIYLMHKKCYACEKLGWT